MVALSVLVSGLDAELVRLGYKDATMAWYRRYWRRLERFFVARGVDEFSLELAMRWVDEACGFFEKEQAGTLKQTDVYLFRVAAMLADYASHGAVLRRYSRSIGKLIGERQPAAHGPKGGEPVEGAAVQVAKTQGPRDALGHGPLAGGGGAVDGDDRNRTAHGEATRRAQSAKNAG